MAMSAGEQQQRRTEQELVTIGGHRYLRAPRPLHFPESAEVPESKLHYELCALLYQLLKHAFQEQACIGNDQFVYWDPTAPSACLAPDAFVRLGQADDKFRSWKVWERGAPQVAVEIISESDEGEDAWQVKLDRYAHLGVEELVRFHAEGVEPKLRIWDRVQNDLVERALGSPCATSNVLPGFWLVVAHAEMGPCLRLSRDELGQDLFLTPAEAEAKARRAEVEAHRAEAQARSVAEARVRELEAELARRQG